mmetsp:Transcript_17824/g.53798  ORF Transcript_17824/g.53798 Transcript_17824/m.53798 type:complete len:168 (+) Transcript_17824:214-717(+)
MALTHSVCRVPALLRILRRGMASDIDSALANALRQATRRIQQADPSATVMTTTESPNVDRGDGWDTSAAPGVRTQGEKMLLRFTCTHDPCDASGEDRVTIKTISKNSYENGVVVVKCRCEQLHLIADNLGWFGGGKTNIEDILHQRGDSVHKSGYWTDGRDIFEVGS